MYLTAKGDYEIGINTTPRVSLCPLSAIYLWCAAAPMAAAASTPGMLWLHQKKSERQRDPTPGQEPWHNLRQPKASKRAAVDANAVGGGECYPPRRYM